LLFGCLCKEQEEEQQEHEEAQEEEQEQGTYTKHICKHIYLIFFLFIIKSRSEPTTINIYRK